jgi:hypothetical protein
MPLSNAQYFFGNSLVFHTGDSAYTNVPVWMDLFAETAGHSYSVSGSFGFLRNFADRDPPFSQWGFAEVEGAWDSDVMAFADASFDSFFITPANFIQDVTPDTNYVGDTRSPLDAVLDVVDTIVTTHPAATILIYEGWADMGPYGADLPIPAPALADYYAYNQGIYHDWYVNLVDLVNIANPDADLGLLPVASILADVLTGPLSTIAIEDLYVDTAPHGTDTIYFLAAMITYQATYGEQVPLPPALFGNVHPDAVTQFAAINTLIETELEAAGFVIGDPPSVPVQLPDGYGLYLARYFALDPAVVDLDAIDFAAPATAEAQNMQPDFLYESGPLWDGGPVDNFAIQFTREIETTEGGVFKLRLTTDEIAHVRIDGVLLLDTTGAPAEVTLEAEVTLTAGTHTIDVRYLDTEQEASLQVDWDFLRPLPPPAAAPALATQSDPEIIVAPEDRTPLETPDLWPQPVLRGDALILSMLHLDQKAQARDVMVDSFLFAQAQALPEDFAALLF